MLSQKERIESEVLTCRRGPFCKEYNAVTEKVHRKELLGKAFLPKNDVVNTHHFSNIITVSPSASRIKETKDAYILMQ